MPSIHLLILNLYLLPWLHPQMLQSYLSYHLIFPMHLKCALILVPFLQLPTSLHLHNCSIFVIAQVKFFQASGTYFFSPSDLKSFNNSLHGSIFKIQLESYLLLLPPSQIGDFLPGTLQMQLLVLFCWFSTQLQKILLKSKSDYTALLKSLQGF